MLTINRILLATDLTDGSEAIARVAWELARRTDADLHVIYADVLHGEPERRGSERPISQTAAQERLEQLTAAVGAVTDSSGQVQVEHIIERNISPSPAILDYAREQDVDLIVMGTHGRRGVRRLILGSVAEEVVRLAQRPVLTIRPPKEDAGSSFKIDSILVPIDFSSHSKNALVHAKELAALFDARLTLLHVVEETLHPAFYGITVQSVYDVDPDIEEKAVDHMIKLMEQVGGAPAEVDFEARPGKAAREIADFAAERDVSMIVMGTHGLTGLDHFLMGSTTERVLRRAGCPVFTVKSMGKQLAASS